MQANAANVIATNTAVIFLPIRYEHSLLRVRANGNVTTANAASIATNTSNIATNVTNIAANRATNTLTLQRLRD